MPTTAAGGPSATVTGSNRRDELSRADWLFLLPDTTGGRVLVLGLPGLGELRALSGRAAMVVVAIPELRFADGLRRDCRQRSLTNVFFVHASSGTCLPFGPGAFTLVAARGKLAWLSLAAPSRASRDIGRVLGRDGVAYLETRTPAGTALARRWVRRCIGSGYEVQAYLTVRRKGTMRAALPLHSARELAGYFFRDVLYGRSRAGRMLTMGARILARLGLLHRALFDRSFVVARPGSTFRPFQYIQRLGSNHGLDFSNHRIALLTHGFYDSNKNAFFLFPAASDQPEILVKATRTAAFNHRLKTEYDSLRALQEKHFVPPGSYPEPVFLDHHGDLAMLAQRVVPGTPFRSTTTAKADCPAARSAIDWVVGLGARSAALVPGQRKALHQRLAALLDRVMNVYDLDSEEGQFLVERLEMLGSAEGEIPLVFRHADAGTWNILITPDGDAAFLDWELSESAGPPLWDLVDFVRSFTTWMDRVAGEPDPILGWRTMLEKGGPAFELHVDSVTRYCMAVGLQRHDIEPLFYFYWLDRALRQAAWADGPLSEASYMNTLRLCIRERHSSALEGLFA